MSARDSDADFAAMLDWRAAQAETDAALAAVEAQLDAERDEAVRQEIARIERRIANMTPREQSRATALALTMRKQRLERIERIERGELCERCGGADIEHTSAITPLFCCKDCNHVVLDLRGAEV